MKVAIYNGKRQVSIQNRPMPEIGESDVLLRNLRAGICGTDINIIKEGSELGIRFGSEFGHEIVSEIILTGDKVRSDIKTGMIVAVNPITAKRAGRRYSLECGGFSQFMVVEEARLNYNLFQIHSDIPLETAVLMEPMSVGRHGAFRANPEKEHKIVVLGAGPIGLGAAASLIAEGINNVCVVDRDEWRLETAGEIGAATLNTSDTDLKTGLSSIFGETEVYGQKMPDVDIFIDAAGAPQLFEEVLNIVKTGAIISVIAVYKNSVPVSLSQIMSKEVHLIGSSGYTNEDLEAVVEYINTHKTKIGAIVSKVYKLDDIQEAFRAAIEADKVIKVLIDLE